jgi:pimeloyl-ACP methyl ester carboxylesterase
VRTSRDVIVVLPGIMGSTLIDEHGDEVWGLQAGTLLRSLFTLARGVRRLRLPEGIGDQHPGDGVRPGVLMPDLHLIPGVWTVSVGYERLLDHLRSTYNLIEYDPALPDRPANLVPFAYDWRLSNRYNARRLKQVVQPVLERWRTYAGQPDARLILVCHSMGGLVARWYLDREGGAAYTNALITIGTPHRGAASAVDRLVNGVRAGLGPLALDLSALARSLPSLHELLPEYACIEGDNGLRKIADVSLPGLNTTMVTDAMAFHAALDGTTPTEYDVHPLVGIHQPTATTVRLNGASATMIRTIEAVDEKGDGTVPRLAASPKGLRGTSPALHYFGETHTALPGHTAVFQQIDGILTASPVQHLASKVDIGVDVPELTVVGQPIDVVAEVSDPTRVFQARLVNAMDQTVVATQRLQPADGRYTTAFTDIPPGAYAMIVGWRNPSGALHDQVTAGTFVVDPNVLNAAAVTNVRAPSP